jgi:hypothetical protein
MHSLFCLSSLESLNLKPFCGDIGLSLGDSLRPFSVTAEQAESIQHPESGEQPKETSDKSTAMRGVP